MRYLITFNPALTNYGLANFNKFLEKEFTFSYKIIGKFSGISAFQIKTEHNRALEISEINKIRKYISKFPSVKVSFEDTFSEKDLMEESFYFEDYKGTNIASQALEIVLADMLNDVNSDVNELITNPNVREEAITKIKNLYIQQIKNWTLWGPEDEVAK